MTGRFTSPMPAPALETMTSRPTPVLAQTPPVPTFALVPVPVPAPAPALALGPREEKRFAQTEAAALLRAHRPPGVGEVTTAYIKSLARLAGIGADRIVRKLWEAVEDRLLLDADAQTALAICGVYDENPDEYD